VRGELESQRNRQGALGRVLNRAKKKKVGEEVLMGERVKRDMTNMRQSAIAISRWGWKGKHLRG